MSVKKSLELVFRNQTGKEVAISLPDPEEGVTLSTAKATAEEILQRKVFTSKGGDLTQYVDVRLRTNGSVSLT